MEKLQDNERYEVKNGEKGISDTVGVVVSNPFFGNYPLGINTIW